MTEAVRAYAVQSREGQILLSTIRKTKIEVAMERAFANQRVVPVLITPIEQGGEHGK